MDDSFRAEIEGLLLQLQAELAARSGARPEPNRRFAEEVGGDEDEQPLNEMLQSVTSGRNRNDARTARLVHKALGKCRDAPEDLGLCEECDEEIPAGRLRALPYAEYCVPCQSRLDGPRDSPTRRSLTESR